MTQDRKPGQLLLHSDLWHLRGAHYIGRGVRNGRRRDRGECVVFDDGEGRVASGRLHYEAGQGRGRQYYVHRSLQRGRGICYDLHKYRFVNPLLSLFVFCKAGIKSFSGLNPVG